MLSNIPHDTEVQFVRLWYNLDENNVPRVYVLQPISSCIPDYVNQSDEAARQRGMQEWFTVMSKLARILRLAAQKVLLVDHKRKYFASGE